MESTNNYSQFKFTTYNRVVDKNHVKKIQKNMEVNGFDVNFPILVNKDFTVVDGQHRLEAAKNLGLDVYYEVSEKDVSPERIIEINSLSKNWNLYDRIHYYAAQGNENYRKILLLFDNYKDFQKNALLAFLTNTKSKDGISGGTSQRGSIIAKGNFIYPNDTMVVAYLAYIREIDSLAAFRSNRYFQLAMWKCFNNPMFDRKRFKEKLELHSMPKRTDVNSYIEEIELIYNWKCIKRNIVKFERL